jgi:hypothetical protein
LQFGGPFGGLCADDTANPGDGMWHLIFQWQL